MAVNNSLAGLLIVCVSRIAGLKPVFASLPKTKPALSEFIGSN